jgi:signal transduction histidine kinase
VNMADRVGAVGGTIRISTGDHGGTEVVGRLPIGDGGG